MKVLLTLLVLGLVLLVKSDPNFCTQESCQHHGDCSGGERCCGGKCTPYAALEMTDELGGDCICSRCDPTVGLFCSDTGVCIDHYSDLLEQLYSCWCEEDIDCVFGSCFDNVCVTPPFKEGQRCESDNQCDDTLRCIGGECTANAAAAGERCFDYDGDCGEGNMCVFEEERHCVPYGLPEGSNCAFGGCQEGLYCDQFLQCAKYKDLGDACFDDDECVSGNCEGRRACRPMKEIDEICSSDSECYSGYCVEKENHRFCSNRWANGKACTSNGDCASQLCQDNVCTAKYETGADCDNNNQCISGRCYQSVCEDKVGEDEDCIENNDCLSGICVTEEYSVCLDKIPVGMYSPYDNRCIYGTRDIYGYCTDADPNNCLVDAACSAGEICPWPNAGSQCMEPLSNGFSCNRNDQCASGACWANSVCGDMITVNCTLNSDCSTNDCDINGKCVPRYADGEACDLNYQCVNTCMENGVCGVPSKANDPATCSYDAQCSTNHCDEVRKCFVPFALGEDCTSDSECETGFCHEDKCSNLLAPGVNCTSNSQCQSTNCQNTLGYGVCALSFCGDELCSLEESCRRDSDCFSGRCHNFECFPALGEEGDECQSTGDRYICGEDLYCGSEENLVCQRHEVPSNCDFDYDCGLPHLGYVCVMVEGDGHCVKRTRLPTSGDCEFDYQCQFFCDPLTRKCTNGYIGLDEQCFFDRHCGPNAECEETGTCFADSDLYALNDLCFDGNCASGLYCSVHTKRCEVLEEGMAKRGEYLWDYQTSSRFICETRFAYDYRCMLVGEVAPGEMCYHEIECAGNAICVEGECVLRNSIALNETCVYDYSQTCNGENAFCNWPGQCTREPDATVSGDSCDYPWDILDYNEDLQCQCVGGDLEYVNIALQMGDPLRFEKEMYSECIDTDIDGFSIPQHISFVIDNSLEGDGDMAACHAAVMRQLCSLTCDKIATAWGIEREYVIRQFTETHGLSQDVLIDCETGLVTTTNSCPDIRFANCGSLNAYYQTIVDYAEELGLPPADEQKPITPRPINSSASVIVGLVTLVFALLF